MTHWTPDDLARLDGAEVYARSVTGPGPAWFGATRALREGHITAAGIDKDVAFLDIDPDDPVNGALDAAYRSKYRRYPGPVAGITSRQARLATLKLTPRQN